LEKARRAQSHGMAKAFLVSMVVLCTLLSCVGALRTVVHGLRPIPVILAELHADQVDSEESGAMGGGSSSMDNQESSFNLDSAESAAGASPVESSQESSGESTISATSTDGMSSSGSSSSSAMESTSNVAMPAPQPGSDPMSQMAMPSESSPVGKSQSAAAAQSSSGTPFPAGSSFSHHPSPVGRSHHSRGSEESSSSSSAGRLPETDVFGEAPHTDLTADQVDLIARAVLMGARKSRCAHEDEYCEMQFKKCKDEKCRRQVEDQSSLSPLEKREIKDLLRN